MITFDGSKYDEVTGLVTFHFSFYGDELTFNNGLLTPKDYQLSKKQGVISLIKCVMARELHYLINSDYKVVE